MEKTVTLNQFEFSSNYETDNSNTKFAQNHEKNTPALCKQQFFENMDLKCQFGGKNKETEIGSANSSVQVKIQAEENEQQLKQEKKEKPKEKKRRKSSIQKEDKVKKPRTKREKSPKIEKQKEKKINKRGPINQNIQLLECFCGRFLQSYQGLKLHVDTKHKYYKQYYKWFSMRYFLRRTPTQNGKTVIKLQQLDLALEFSGIMTIILQIYRVKQEWENNKMKQMKRQSISKKENNVQVKIEQIDYEYKRQPTNVKIQEQTGKYEQAAEKQQTYVYQSTFEWKHLLLTNKDLYHYHMAYMYDTNKEDNLTKIIFYLLRVLLDTNFFSKLIIKKYIMRVIKSMKPAIFNFIQINFNEIAKGIDKAIKKHFQNQFSVNVEKVGETINDFFSWLKVQVLKDKKQTQESEKLSSTVKKEEKMQE